MSDITAGRWRAMLAGRSLPTVRWPDIAIPAALALATFAAALPWLRAFRVPWQAGLLLAASIFPVAVTAVLAGFLRRTAGASYATSAALLMALLLAISAFHPVSVARSLAQVPDRLIAETLPLTGSPDILGPVLVLTWLCGAVSAELAYRTSGRRRLGDLALVVPVAFFVLSYAVSAGAPGLERVAGGVLFAALVLLALSRHEQPGSALVAAPAPPGAVAQELGRDASVPVLLRRRVVGLLAVCVALATALTAILAGTGLLSGRAATLNKAAPVSAPVIDDPVGATSTLRDGNPGTRPFPVIRIASNRSSSGYLAAALLDDFDGSEWTFNATFEPTGERVPAPSGSIPLVGAVSVRTVETVESALPFPLLPVPDRPVSVSGPSVSVDTSTAMVLPKDATTGSTFTIVSETPGATLAGVPAVDGIGVAGSAAARTVSPDLAIPPDSTTALATALRFVAGMTGSRPAPTVAFLQRVVLALHSREQQLSPYAPAVPGQGAGQQGASREGQPAGSTPPSTAGEGGGRLGGTSLSEVINAVTVNRSATPEQFATFFALIARDLGVPARIATGFRVATASDGTEISGGTHQVYNRQAWTWVEIPVAGMGWVVADPTPDTLTGIAAPPPEQAQATPTTLPTNKANAVPKNSITGGHAIAKPARIGHHRSSGLSVWFLALFAAAGLLLAVIAAGPALFGVRRRLRSRARRSGDPTLLATGAWLELLDALDRAGMRVPGSFTSSEIATEAAAHFGAEVKTLVTEVGQVADRGLYSNLDPPTMDDALRAWRLQRELTRDVLQTLDRRQRARALVAVGSSPRSPLQ